MPSTPPGREGDLAVNAVPAATRRSPARTPRLSWRRRLAGALTGVVVLPLLTWGLAQLRGALDLPSQTLLYLLAVVVVALVGGLPPALAAAAAAAVLLDHYFIPPLYDFAVADPRNAGALVAFLLVAVAASSVVGLATRRREAEARARANAEGREELRSLLREQAALRRVATLVARGTPPAEGFAAVAVEVGRVLGADSTNIVRFDAEGAATVVASVGTQPLDQVPVGTRWKPEPPMATATVLRTGHAARSDDYTRASGIAGDAVRRLGVRSGVAVPILVDGKLWGAIAVGTQGERFPADAEQRLADFTELVGTAIANAEGRAQLEESRDQLSRLAGEQAALRRVATLVARGVPRAEVFAAVAREVGSVLGADATPIARLDPDGLLTVVAVGGNPPAALVVGSRWNPEPPLAFAEVLRTGRPARDEDYDHATGPSGEAIRRMGIDTGVASPIIVEGQIWGVIAIVGWHGRFPDGTEERMAGFTELVGTAIANAEGRAELEESRDDLRRLADEQAALRRVATLVARGVPPAEVFEAVAHEVGRVVDADGAGISRVDADGAITVCACVGVLADALGLGSRWRPEPPLALAVVLRTGRPARNEDYREDGGLPPLGIRSGVAAPIIVEGRLWGAISVATRQGLFPDDTEARMAGFTELAGTAIANADSRAQLTASRARIVSTADSARRHIERDLHDGTQQRLVAISLTLRLAQATVPPGLTELQDQLGRIADELTGAIEELREIARGIHPAILSEGGLGPALRTLARRAAIPVELDLRTTARAADPIEVAAYYVVSEALTNATKYARASCARVAIDQRDGRLDLSIRDDGVGGADPAGGSGLIGLRDRVQALGGSIEVDSPPGAGTAIVVELPLHPG
jgi:signal transduction histidine kinase